jgi:DNA (cytosine-5)-methyltransferase 1
MSPRLLDLYCCAGGAGAGYYLAGFDVVGVDKNPQPRYPFEFIQADALEYLQEHGHEYDAIHASPPCQLWASGHNPNRHTYPDLIAPTRELLEALGLPYIIENVPRAPLENPIMVCGAALGCTTSDMQLHRHRHFESNIALVGTDCGGKIRPITLSVTGTGTPTGSYRALGRAAKLQEFKDIMGMEWANRKELSEAIPPAYTEYLGKQLIQAVQKQAA